MINNYLAFFMDPCEVDQQGKPSPFSALLSCNHTLVWFEFVLDLYPVKVINLID